MKEFRTSCVSIIISFNLNKSQAEVYLEPYQTSMTEIFAKMVDGWKTLDLFFTKRVIIDIWQLRK